MNTTALFEKFLRETKKVSKNTVRFYRSDLNHFFHWIVEKLKPLGVLVESLDEALPYLNSEIVSNYKSSLHEANVAVKSINRKLSTLRSYSAFLVNENYIPVDFSSSVENISLGVKVGPAVKENSVLDNFEAYLTTQGASKNTVKNYMADIKQFFDFINTNAHLTN